MNDLMVGAVNRTYMLFLEDDIRKPVAAQTFLGQDRFGFNVLGSENTFGSAITTSSADIDGDSHDDLVITDSDGELFLFWGTVTSLLTSSKSLTDVDLRYSPPELGIASEPQTESPTTDSYKGSTCGSCKQIMRLLPVIIPIAFLIVLCLMAYFKGDLRCWQKTSKNPRDP